MHELAKRMCSSLRVVVITPSACGAREREILDGVEIIRFRYAPRRFETLVHDGGIVANLRRSPWKWLLLPTFFLAQLGAALKVVKRYDVDVMHAHWLVPQGLVAMLVVLSLRKSLPFVVTSHGGDLYSLRSWPFKFIKRLVARRADALTVVSEAMRAEAGSLGLAGGEILVKPMGVDLTNRFTCDDSVERSEDEILFVGRLVEKKGLIHLIDAMPSVRARHPSAKLTIVGFGPERAARQAQVDSLGLAGCVNFVGAVSQDELPAYFRRAAVFVAPFVEAKGGDREGLGLVVIEAAGCGCPIVVSDLPQVRDVFKGFSPAAWVNPGAPAEIANSINSVLSQCSSLPSSVAPSLRERFDWDCVADGYSSLLLSIVERDRTDRIRG